MATDLENLQSANSDSYTVDSVLIGEERLKLATGGNGWKSPPVLYTYSGSEIGRWDTTNNVWTSTDSSGVFDAEWFNENSGELNAAGAQTVRNDTAAAAENYQPEKTRDETTAKTDDNTKDLFGAIADWGLDTDPNPGTTADETAFAIEPILKYPQDHSSQEYDFIKIIPMEYVPALTTKKVGDAFNTLRGTAPGDIMGFRNINERYRRINKVGSTVFLPMVPDIQENNAVDWGSDTLSPIQAAAGQIAAGAIGAIANASNMEQAGSAVAELTGNLTGGAQQLINTPGVSNWIKTYFAGKAVNANLLGRAGIAINPNLEVLFNGPLLRTFTYNFRFTPRDKEEARIVRKIIKVFKKTMAVKRRDKVFLGVPAVYKIQYIFNTGFRDHPFLNKIKPCALSNFNVSYAPDGSYMTYEDGSMTSYNVQMKFDELEPVYNDDINDVDDPTTGF